jgi:hypothetical protein
MALATLLGGVYGATLLPGAGYSPDTAEMQFSGRLLCVTHPTGNPAYLLLNHAFSWLVPLGSIAFRANLLSAVLSVLTCLVLRRVLLRLGTREVVAFSLALAFGVTPTFWRLSVVAEVYSLHSLFLTLVVDALLKWRETQRRRHLVLTCGLLALSFGNHLSMVTLLPAAAFLVLATEWRVMLDWKTVLSVGGIVFLGMLQYAYPMWRTLDPATPYLSVPVTSWSELWAYATGASFRGAMFAFSPGQLVSERIPLFVRHLWEEGGILVFLAVAGLAGFKDRVIGAFLALAFLGHLAFALNYDIDDIDVYFIPSVLVTAVVAGIGLERILDPAPGRRLPWAACLVLPIALCIAHWSRVEEGKGTEKAQLMRALLEDTHERALIVARYNDYMYLLYFSLAEGLAPGVFIGNEVSVEELKAYLEQNQPVYLRPTRERVPPGLPVYCTRLDMRPQLRDAGLSVEMVRTGVFRVDRGPRPALP